MPDYIKYDLKITMLSPLHIGTGRILLNHYDYSIRNGHTWRINEGALLDAQKVDDERTAALLVQQKPEQLLKDDDFQPDSPFFRYVIKGTPKATGEGAELREQMKDPHDQLYLPGTTLKGALRTAIGWYAWGEKQLRPEITKLESRREWASSGYERDIFGPTPNKSLMRALQVGDSAPVGADRLMLLNVRVLNRGGKPGSPVEVEAIRRETVFESGIKLDSVLFSDWAKKRDLFLNGRNWLEGLAEICRQHSIERIRHEKDWYENIPGCESLVNHYRTMQEFALASNQFFLQLGWGAGWEEKTFGSRLQADQGFMERILKPVREGGYGIAAMGHRKPGDPFPKSRRVAMAYQRDEQGQVTHEIPALPLGWVLVEMKQL